MIQVMMVLTDKPEVDRSMQPYLLKNSPRSTLLPLLRVGMKLKKVIGIDLLGVLYNSWGPIFIPRA